MTTNTDNPPRKTTMQKVIFAAAIFSILFGALTIFSGGTILFGTSEIRAQAGQIVPWVLWFNFLCGFAYIAAGAGLLFKKRWALPLAILIAVATVLTFAALGIHIATGGAYENRTLAAMALRSGIWVAIATLVYLYGDIKRRIPS